jgi:ethanolamine utilization protein EutN
VEAEGTGQRLIAFDVLGSGVGERVLVTQGSVAAAWFAGKPPPVDALIIGSIDPGSPRPPKAPESPGTPAAGGGE